NIFKETLSGKLDKPDWKKVLEEWFNELKVFNNKDYKKFKVHGPKTENFTQMIWAKSYLVGCGYAQVQKSKGYETYYICRYANAGNIMNKPIFNHEDKKICKCLKGQSCGNKDFPGLCCFDGYCSNDKLTYE